MPIFDRLFLGGARTMRGFKYREVGPEGRGRRAVGGQSALYATAEYTDPAWPRRSASRRSTTSAWSGPDAYQFDFGDLNSDCGVGVRFDFPGFPLQLDYAWPLEADEFNDKLGPVQLLAGLRVLIERQKGEWT